MATPFVNRRDLAFQLFEALDVEALTVRPRFAEHGRETFLAALDAAIAIAAEKFLPHNRKADEHEPTFDGERVRLLPEVKEALDAYVAAGFLAAHREYGEGGMQLPATVARACQAVFEAANVYHMIARHLNDQPVPPSHIASQPIPEALDRLILACLAKEPGDRPQTALELSKALSEVPVEAWTNEQAEKWWSARG